MLWVEVWHRPKIVIGVPSSFENVFEFNYWYDCSPSHLCKALLSPRDLSGPSLDLDFKHRLKTETWVISPRMSMWPKQGQSEYSLKILLPLSGRTFFPSHCYYKYKDNVSLIKAGWSYLVIKLERKAEPWW